MKMEESWKNLLSHLSAKKREVTKDSLLYTLSKDLPELLRKFVFYDDHLEKDYYLVHYTSWENALAIFQPDASPTMRMYNYETANDPQEGRLWRKGWNGVKAASEWLDEYSPEHERTLKDSGRSMGSTYGCAFSSGIDGMEDDLTFWRFYGNDGEGCSFKLTGRIANAYRVRYLRGDGENSSRKDEKIDAWIADKATELLDSCEKIVKAASPSYHRDGAIVVRSLRQLLAGYHHLAKSCDYEDEREWRMIRVSPEEGCVQFERDDDNIVKRYIEELSLKGVLVTGSSITIGPRVPNVGAARAYLERFVRAQGMSATKVKISRQTYKLGV